MSEKTYRIHSIFDTLQGEGVRAGQRSIFVRFSGCNLWNGRPSDRDKGKGACAQWCDTDFVKGQPMTAFDIVSEVKKLWGKGLHRNEPDILKSCWVVFTGGEPLLQMDAELMDAFRGIHCALETNGTLTRSLVTSLDWVCVAPKLGTEIVTYVADEVKVVIPGHDNPQLGWTPEMLWQLEQHFPKKTRLFVQPQDPLVVPTQVEETALKRKLPIASKHSQVLAARYHYNLRWCIDWVMKNPRWSLSLQTHKFTGLPLCGKVGQSCAPTSPTCFKSILPISNAGTCGSWRAKKRSLWTCSFSRCSGKTRLCLSCSTFRSMLR